MDTANGGFAWGLGFFMAFYVVEGAKEMVGSILFLLFS